LRSANKHLDQIIVQAVKELTLKGPLKLRVVEVPGMQLEIIGMHGSVGVFELDDDFHRFAFGARVEVQQWVFVKSELMQDAVEARIGIGHISSL